jgi:hypothetical protein
MAARANADLDAWLLALGRTAPPETRADIAVVAPVLAERA